MPALNVKDYLREDVLIGKMFVGTVVENDDSQSKDGNKMGRIKVRVKELHGEESDVPDDQLPWFAPNRRVQFGAADNVSSLYVPEKDSKVTVLFDKGDQYSGFYVGEPLGSQTGFKETEDTVFPGE